jgi:cyclophilin family peptidyl-prolyl cis-trans isomerase
LKNLIYAAAVLTLGACAPANQDATATNTTATTATAANTTMSTNPAAATTSSSMSDMKVAPASTPAATEENRPMSYYQNKVAELHTTAGEIDIRFFPDVAPNHVKNFVDLAEKGFYNGTKFHRVIPEFMIQGGDPNTVSGSPSTWGIGGSGKNVNAEFNTVSHKRGIVSMARSSDPNSASSQFFIVVKDSPFLDRQYTAFGEVAKGMDVVDKLVTESNPDTSDPRTGGLPRSFQKIVKVELVEDTGQ